MLLRVPIMPLGVRVVLFKYLLFGLMLHAFASTRRIVGDRPAAVDVRSDDVLRGRVGVARYKTDGRRGGREGHAVHAVLGQPSWAHRS